MSDDVVLYSHSQGIATITLNRPAKANTLRMEVIQGLNDALADAVRLDPDDGWVRVVFGLTLLEADRPEEATGELMSGARRREADMEAQLAAALAAAATGRDGVAYEMLERGRLSAVEGDAQLVAAIEDRIDAGHEAAASLLHEDFAPDLLRTRLRERP